MHIKTVTIVGGGSSGWMAAAALAKLCPQLDITLIESDSVKTIGVGESTLGHINKFLHLLGLKDEDWMAQCNATYKNSIRFTNFREGKGEVFEYPFSPGLDLTDKPQGLNSWSDLAAMYPDEYGPETFAEFFCTGNTMLAKYNKETRDEKGVLRNYNFKYDTAYHLDAALFGQFLKEKIAIPNGVKHIKGDVHSYKKNHRGDIAEIFTESGQVLQSDLWIDCTGFKSILLEHWMGSQFISFEKSLANDSAIACRIPYIDREKEMHNVTDCHALDNGWVWNIPLWNRIGTGYVFSSRFTTVEDAEKEFRQHLAKSDKKRAEEAEIFPIKISHGKRRRAWVGNVVGVGLSYGFVEPLESTGLLTTHENIIKLVETLNRRNGFVSRIEVDGFNMSVDREVTGFRDFIAMHYAFSQRTDTPYWRWCTEINEYSPDMMNDFIPTMGGFANIIGNVAGNQLFSPESIGPLFIAAGQGIRPMSLKQLVMYKDWSNTKIEELNATRRMYEQYRDYVIEYVKSQPSHYQFLKDNIYGGKDDFAL
jgi:flavin-dependent dehydrogenase